MLLVVLAVLCGAALAGSLTKSASERGTRLHAFTAGSLERIRPADAARPLETARLTAARGETESFQVAVRGPARRVTAAMSALAGPEGATIAAANVALYREQAVLVEHSTPYSGGPNPPDPAGEIPDALIPFSAPGGRLRAQPFTVPDGRNAVLFADVTVPRDATAGVYRGELTLRAAGRPPLAVPVALTVWSFALPRRPTLGSSFGIWDVPRRQASSLLLHNRLQPGAVLARDVGALRPLGLTAAGLPFWSGADATTCSFDSPPSASAVQRAVRALGDGLRLHDYTADEIDNCPDAVASLRAWGRALHAGGVQQLATATPSAGLMDDGTGRPAVDIWALGPAMMQAAEPYLPAVRAAGGQIWTYTALVPDPAAPIWTLDEPLINERILPGFLGHALGATGVLYWRIDAFGAGDPWTAAASYESGGEQYPGDGQLVYPGAAVGVQGVVPSLRLKALRDGEEDYELLGLAQRAGIGAQADAIALGVARDWDTWSRDPRVLERARTRIGNLLAGTLG
ncbi:MAG: hypothetical protein QOH00_1561 [Gaiellales bacterium]|nr:hypothetical protein [Gaiellales bacterium]